MGVYRATVPVCDACACKEPSPTVVTHWIMNGVLRGTRRLIAYEQHVVPLSLSMALR